MASDSIVFESDLTSMFLIIVAMFVAFGACLILLINSSSLRRDVDITAAEKFSAVVVVLLLDWFWLVDVEDTFCLGGGGGLARLKIS